ncbi:MAG: O-antigen polymerase [Candidatus Lokiarchaeia archaeon]
MPKNNFILAAFIFIIGVLISIIILKIDEVYILAFSLNIFIATFLIKELIKHRGMSLFYGKTWILIGFLIFGGLGIIRSLFVTKEIELYNFNIFFLSFLLWIFGLLLFLITYPFGNKSKGTKLVSLPKYNTYKTTRLALLLFVIGYVGYFLPYKDKLETLFIIKYGGYGTEIPTIKTSIQFLFGSFLLPATAIGYLLIKKRKSIIIKCLLFILIANAFFWILVSGDRNNLLIMIFAIYCISLHINKFPKNENVSKKFSASWIKILLIFILCLVLIPSMAIIRTAGVESLEKETFFKAIKFMDYADTFDSTLFLVNIFPSQKDFMGLYSIYTIFVNPIPRKIWTSKPIGVGKILVELQRGRPVPVGYSRAVSLPAESYINLGFLGVILNFSILGIFVGKIDRIIKNNFEHWAITIFSPLISFQLLMIIRGDLLTQFMRFLFIIFLPWIISLLLLGKSRNTSG